MHSNLTMYPIGLHQAGAHAIAKGRGEIALLKTRLALLEKNAAVIPPVQLRHLEVFRDYFQGRGITANQSQPDIVGDGPISVGHSCLLVPFYSGGPGVHTESEVIAYHQEKRGCIRPGKTKDIEYTFWICDQGFDWYELTATVEFSFDQYKYPDRYEEFGRCTKLRVRKTDVDSLVTNQSKVIDHINTAISLAVERWVSATALAHSEAKKVADAFAFEDKMKSYY